LPNFSKEIPKKFLGFPNFSKDFQTFSLAVSREIKGLSVGRTGIAFPPNFCVVSAATSGPGAAMPKAPAIHHSVNSDYRKEIVAIFRKRPQGERGVACARATSAESAVEGRGGADRESLAPTAGRENRQFVSCPRKREAETRRIGATRQPSMGEMRLAQCADSPFPRRATRHNDASRPFEDARRRL
jgi:hypothetical protein